MKIAKYKHYIKNKDSEVRPESLRAANSLFTELLNYGLIADDEVLARISLLKPEKALKFCKEIAAEYTVGALNPPLFKNWEEREFFSVEEFCIQIFGYIFQIGGNDLQDPEFSRNLLKDVDFKKFKTLSLATDEEVTEYATNLFNANVSQDKATLEKLIKAAKYLDFKFLGEIKSDEARIAALIGLSKDNNLLACLNHLKCKPADVLRFAAAKNDFSLVKLPADVKYAHLSWGERIASLKFLQQFDFEYLSEGMSINRAAWNRYFNHVHLLSQKGFPNRFRDICVAYYTANGNRLDHAGVFTDDIKKLVKSKLVEVTDGGTLAFRNFVSRMQSAIEAQDIDEIQALGEKRPNYILRNLTSVANGVTAKTNKKFSKFVKSLLKDASPDVLFSILSIDVAAKWRIIDVKGDTRVEPANYNPVIGDIQKGIESEIHSRWGYPGKVEVQNALKDSIVPFLAKNTNLARGTKFKVEKRDFLYLYVHWIQGGQRTDIDHSFLTFNSKWESGMVNFRNQSNGYIAQSGDITSAPAPNGATEYGQIKLNSIPKDIKYIVPVINSWTGNTFDDNKEVRAGFWASDEKVFTLDRKHNTYKLDQPAKANIPFVFDVDNSEILLLDINMRDGSAGSSAGQYVEVVKNVISATQTKNYISIRKLAKMLSGDKDEVSFTITNKAENNNEITPENLFSLFSE